MTVNSEDVDWTLNETEPIPESEAATLPVPPSKAGPSSSSRSRCSMTPNDARRVPPRVRGIVTNFIRGA